jgi:hypothetical protein
MEGYAHIAEYTYEDLNDYVAEGFTSRILNTMGAGVVASPQKNM